jgi:hypothetical protein
MEVKPCNDCGAVSSEELLFPAERRVQGAAADGSIESAVLHSNRLVAAAPAGCKGTRAVDETVAN